MTGKELWGFRISVVCMLPFAAIGFCVGAIYYGIKLGLEIACDFFFEIV